MKRKIILLLMILSALLIAGCSAEEQSENEDGVLKVYTTVYPLQFFAEEIGGEFIKAESVYPPGADEHTFEPSQKDMISIADSDLFIYIGLGLEGFVEKAKSTLANEQVTMLPAGEAIHFEEDEHEHGEHEEEHSHDGHSHGSIDPHVWLDPLYSKQLAESIKDALTNLLPEQEAYFESNLDELTAELDQLDADFQSAVSDSGKHEIIVAHSAYGYWEERYGIEQLSISGLSTTSEPSQKELQKLIEHARTDGLEYVLFEQNFQSRLAETVQKELGAKALYLHNLSVLTKDDIKNGETYFTLMDKNIETLRTALSQ